MHHLKKKIIHNRPILVKLYQPVLGVLFFLKHSVCMYKTKRSCPNLQTVISQSCQSTEERKWHGRCRLSPERWRHFVVNVPSNHRTYTHSQHFTLLNVLSFRRNDIQFSISVKWPHEDSCSLFARIHRIYRTMSSVTFITSNASSSFTRDFWTVTSPLEHRKFHNQTAS